MQKNSNHKVLGVILYDHVRLILRVPTFDNCITGVVYELCPIWILL